MKLMERVRAKLRTSRYSYRTEQAYCHWIKRYLAYHGMRHPEDMGEAEITRFLSHLAVRESVAAPTQNQALSAVLFMYHHVLKRAVGDVAALRGRVPRKIPKSLEPSEVSAILSELKLPALGVAQLMYGSGLRLAETLSLRVQDVEFGRGVVRLQNTKGGRPRCVPLPKAAVGSIRAQTEETRELCVQDRTRGVGGASLPFQFDKKCPRARWAPGFQYVFPSRRLSTDPQFGRVRRHHISPSTVRKRLQTAAREAGVHDRVTCHSLRHSFATHLLRSGTDIRTIQKLMGHKHVSTTMIYLHVLDAEASRTRSPLDLLAA